MKLVKCAIALLIFFVAVSVLHAQVPGFINYQGRVTVAGTNFDGTGQFEFALVNNGATQTYWSNGVNVVSLTVTKGLYSVLLGDTGIANMDTVIPSAVFTNADVRLRVWFDDGVSGLQQLSPDQRLAAVGYALMSATVPDGAITSDKIAAGAVGTAQLASNAVTAALIASIASNSAADQLHAEQVVSNSAITGDANVKTTITFQNGTATFSVTVSNNSALANLIAGAITNGYDGATLFNAKLTNGVEIVSTLQSPVPATQFGGMVYFRHSRASNGDFIAPSLWFPVYTNGPVGVADAHLGEHLMWGMGPDIHHKGIMVWAAKIITNTITDIITTGTNRFGNAAISLGGGTDPRESGARIVSHGNETNAGFGHVYIMRQRDNNSGLWIVPGSSVDGAFVYDSQYRATIGLGRDIGGGRPEWELGIHGTNNFYIVNNFTLVTNNLIFSAVTNGASIALLSIASPVFTNADLVYSPALRGINIASMATLTSAFLSSHYWVNDNASNLTIWVGGAAGGFQATNRPFVVSKIDGTNTTTISVPLNANHTGEFVVVGLPPTIILSNVGDSARITQISRTGGTNASTNRFAVEFHKGTWPP